MFGKFGDMMGKLQEMKQKTEEIKLKLDNTILDVEGACGDIKISCHVRTNGNTGFLSTQILNNGGLPCIDLVYPKIEFISPTFDTIVTTEDLTQYQNRFKVKVGDLSQARVSVMQGAQTIASDLSPELSDSLVSYLIDLPAGNFINSYTARIESDGSANPLVGFSNTISIRRKLPVVLSTRQKNTGNVRSTAFPNPSAGVFTIRTTECVYRVSVANIVGKNIAVESNIKNGIVQINASNICNGQYIVKLETQSGTKLYKVMIAN